MENDNQNRQETEQPTEHATREEDSRTCEMCGKPGAPICSSCLEQLR